MYFDMFYLKKVFSKAGLKIAFKSSRNLKSILTKRNKPQLPPNSLPGVYIIPCKCQSRYTGQTGAKVKKRTKEHQKAVFNGKYDESAISEHTKDCPHEVDWEHVKTLSVQPKYFHRCVRESLEIRRQNTGPDAEKGMNKDYGQYVVMNGCGINLLLLTIVVNIIVKNVIYGEINSIILIR